MTGVAAASPATTPAAAPAPSGEPLREPPQYTSSHGVLRARIVVERRKVELAGRKVYALTYNGFYMPPTLRLRPGDRMELAMVNKVRPYTNLHVHGLHVSPVGHSDNVFVHIHPGQTFHYRYQFPRDLAPGTYWYHSHGHPYAAPQVLGGMSGIIIVDGLRRHLPPGLRTIEEHVVALKDFQLEDDAIRSENIKIGAPTNRTVNGQIQPRIQIRPGETQLWRLANISANIYYRLHLPGQRFHVIAQDANPVDRVWSADTLLIPAGARYDVLVQGGPSGRVDLETLPYNTGPGGNQFPQVTLASVVSGGAPERPAQLPSTFAPRHDLSNARVAARRTVVFSESDPPSGDKYYINGRTFDEQRVDIRSRLNTVEEWTVRNTADEQHSFHMHTNDFQVMSVNGHPYKAHSLQDTVNLPVDGTAVIRIRFADYPGRTVFHCHILNHEDEGMMAVLQIVR
ncbi:multicopper oxidase family protein [Actinopolymorpha pittospori]